jgi:CDP-paratose 2-epimerase
MRMTHMKRVLITGSCGLIGSSLSVYFGSLGWDVYGIDNNMRANFFGADGDTSSVLRNLRTASIRYTHKALDIRDRNRIADEIKAIRPDLIVHCAGQPSHDLAKDRPFDDFEINALATMNLLEAARKHCPESPFVFLSTNKVYGDAPNRLPLIELETRFEYAEKAHYHGIGESCSIDQSKHSLMGVSKLSADIMVQEYGRYFGMPTVSLRCGCITGAAHAAAELHGFMAYMAKAVREERTYVIYGYKGKQVRDNLHAYDVCTAVHAFAGEPQAAAVYNLGGGRENSVSVLEALGKFEELMGKKAIVQYIDQPRNGDHICYISDTSKFRVDFPQWSVSRSLNDIFGEFAFIEAPAKNAIRA